MNNSEDWVFNFATEEMVAAPFPQTDEEARWYIPQNAAIQGLYEVRRGQGDSIEAAMMYALKAAVGEIDVAL